MQIAETAGAQAGQDGPDGEDGPPGAFGRGRRFLGGGRASSCGWGAAVAAFLGGYLFDLFASYDWVWILAIVTAVSAAFICLTIPERRGPVAREAAVFT